MNFLIYIYIVLCQFQGQISVHILKTKAKCPASRGPEDTNTILKQVEGGREDHSSPLTPLQGQAQGRSSQLPKGLHADTPAVSVSAHSIPRTQARCLSWGCCPNPQQMGDPQGSLNLRAGMC